MRAVITRTDGCDREMRTADPQVERTRPMSPANCHSEQGEESLPAPSALGVGMFRLRRSSASLHSGYAQHDIVRGARGVARFSKLL
jgi:hypothetical protein